MTDQAANADTNVASLTLEEILSGKKLEEKQPEAQEAKEETKAEATKEAEAPKEEPKQNPELDTLKRRLTDTQKWGNNNRQALLDVMKNLRDKGLSEEEIAEAVGGQEKYNSILKGNPVDAELTNPMSVVEAAFNAQAATAAAVMKEMGHTEEELAEFMEAFNKVAYNKPEHRDELYRRATAGEGSVAAYALKVGKEVLEEYRVAKTIETKGPKAFEQELAEKLRKQIEDEFKAKMGEAREELGTSKKPRLVSGQPSTIRKEDSTAYPSLKDILGR